MEWPEHPLYSIEVSASLVESPKSCQVWLTPDQFLSLCSDYIDISAVQQKRASIANHPDNPLSIPFLKLEHIKGNEYEVVGHEKRHQTAALREIGHTSVPVALNFYPKKPVSLKGIKVKPEYGARNQTPQRLNLQEPQQGSVRNRRVPEAQVLPQLQTKGRFSLTPEKLLGSRIEVGSSAWISQEKKALALIRSHGFEMGRVLGQGSYGRAFMGPEGSVWKLTQDAEEANTVSRLLQYLISTSEMFGVAPSDIREEQFPALPAFYDAWALQGTNLYLIRAEYVPLPISEEAYDWLNQTVGEVYLPVELIRSALGLPTKNFPNRKGPHQKLVEGILRASRKELPHWDAEGIYDVVQTALALIQPPPEGPGLAWVDFHLENVRMDEEGRWKIIDLGHSASMDDSSRPTEISLLGEKSLRLRTAKPSTLVIGMMGLDRFCFRIDPDQKGHIIPKCNKALRAEDLPPLRFLKRARWWCASGRQAQVVIGACQTMRPQILIEYETPQVEDYLTITEPPPGGA